MSGGAESSLALILLTAAALDLVLGDPRRLPHPVRWMGAAIARLEPPFRSLSASLFTGGLLFAVSLILATLLLSAVLVSAVRAVHPWAGFAVEAVLVFYCVSARSLEKEAMTVYRFLERGDVVLARDQVQTIVGRDVKTLNPEGIARATVETVAENLVDGFVSPLFYAAVGGAPLALAYKMVNTLDSMIGYKNERYRAFGKAAARIDDAANFIPARLSVPLVAAAVGMLSGNWRRVIRTAWNEGRRHSSPNAGFPEAAFAGALSVRLGGPNVYHGRVVEKPYIGVGLGPVRASHIPKARGLLLVAALLWTAVLAAVAGAIRWIG